MTQRDLNRAVASATSESLSTIMRLGFSIADPADVDFDPEPNDLPPQMVDWDALDAERHDDDVWRRHYALAAV